MTPGNSNEHLTGKVQYIQENQGFIRCQKKVFKKRDVIFFTKDVAVETRLRLQVGCHVMFHIVCDSTRRNCKGIDITHWAMIDAIIDNDATCDPDREVCISSASSTTADSSFSEDSDSQPVDVFSNSLPLGLSEYDVIQRRRIISDLYSTVYESLYKTALVAITNQSSPYRSCWDIS